MPKLRFRGFTDDWEQRKLGDVSEYNNGLGHEEYVQSNGKYELITLKSINSEGRLVSSGKYVNKEFETLKKDTLIMMLSEQAKGMLGMTTVIPCNNKYVLNQRVASLVPKDNINPYFLTRAINIRQTYFEQMGAGTKVQNISKGHVENCELLIPSTDEQSKIGHYFETIDNLIALYQRKCDELQKVKKYMLQKMFPKKGEKVPEIRFAGFTGDWEQRKLNNITDVRDGTHDSPGYVDVGHPFVTSKNVKNGYINYDDVQYISDYDFEQINKRSQVDVDDILMGMIGTIGNLALIREKPDFAIKNVALIKHTGETNPFYLYSYLQADSVSRQLSNVLAGGTQNFIALKNIRELDIAVPNKHEQAIIGEYFSNLDNLIALHKRKHETLKEIKKYMLQNMFPKK